MCDRSRRSVPTTKAISGPRGFAAMDPDKRRLLSSLGGIAAHKSGRAHEFDSTEAREAGRKGGASPRRRRGDGRCSICRGDDHYAPTCPERAS